MVKISQLELVALTGFSYQKTNTILTRKSNKINCLYAICAYKRNFYFALCIHSTYNLNMEREGNAKTQTELRNVRFIVRLLSSEREAFQDAADLAGMPLSAWVRNKLRQAAIKELEAQALPIAFLSDKY